MNKREWKRYAKELEDYVVARIDQIRKTGAFKEAEPANETGTSTPDPLEAGKALVLTILHLRRVRMARMLNCGHINITPDIEAELLMLRSFSSVEWLTTGQPMHYFGMEFHLDEDGRSPLEIW